MHTIGYDTAGALMFDENSEEDRAIFREIPSKELSDRIEQLERAIRGMVESSSKSFKILVKGSTQKSSTFSF